MATIFTIALTQNLPLQSIASSFVIPILLFPLLLQACRLVRQDYHDFLSLGPGGTPSTPLGYLRICLLRLIARHDVLTAPAPLRQPSALLPFFQSTQNLPSRNLPRPRVAGIAPHRQMTQRANREDVFALQRAMRDLETKNTGTLKTGKSCFEKHSLALFLSSGTIPSSPMTANADIAEHETYNGPEWRNSTCGAPPEIAHLHGTDGSLHLTLHPSDAKVVIEKGWGERHPLAGRGNWVPKGFLLIYAPRNQKELAVVVEIMKAGGWWVGGVTLEA